MDGDTRVDPGDTLRYTVTVSNTGMTAIMGVNRTNTIDSNTTLVGGTVRTSPWLVDTVDTSALAYTENGAAAAIVPNIVLTDPDGTLASATVQITGNYQNGQDVLSFVNTAKIQRPRSPRSTAR